MEKARALQIVYELAEQNTLRESEAMGDDVLFAIFKDQEEALALVWRMIHEEA